MIEGCNTTFTRRIGTHEYYDGFIFGDVKRAVTSGAAVGGVAGAAGGAISPDQLKQAYTNKCLRDQGYEIVGWD